jgi:hypothetical protein
MTKITIKLDDNDWLYLIKMLNRMHDEAQEAENKSATDMIERITKQLIDGLI